jgi:hypothetical protein
MRLKPGPDSRRVDVRGRRDRPWLGFEHRNGPKVSAISPAANR